MLRWRTFLSQIPFFFLRAEARFSCAAPFSPQARKNVGVLIRRRRKIKEPAVSPQVKFFSAYCAEGEKHGVFFTAGKYYFYR